MLAFLADLQTWLGVKVDWGAIGAFLALMWAVQLAGSQNRDQRRREAAIVRGVMEVAWPMFTALDRFDRAYRARDEFLDAHPEARAWDEERDENLITFLDARGEQGSTFLKVSNEARSAKSWANVQSERVFKRLQAIDPLTIPSTVAIDALHKLELATELCLPPSNGSEADYKVGTRREQLAVFAEQMERLRQVERTLSRPRGDADRRSEGSSHGDRSLGLLAAQPILYVFAKLGRRRSVSGENSLSRVQPWDTP
jgi:hypothetical protein